MNDMVYTLKPVKVCLEDDDNIFDAYLVGHGRRGFCEKNSGGYEHPHFTKSEAMRVMEVFNYEADHGMNDGTRYSYDADSDMFIEEWCDSIDCVYRDDFGMYEIGIDMSWVLV